VNHNRRPNGYTYRCVAIDIPGYGRSPTAEAGLTTADMAEACWEAVDDAVGDEAAILVGSSVGSLILPYMYHHQPDRAAALIMAGVGYYPGKEFAKRRIDAYTSQGVDYRWPFVFELCSPAFRATPLAHYFAELFSERNDTADLQTIIHQFKALQQPEPDGHHEDISCPAVILTGSEDAVHQEAFALQARIPNCELKILPGAGHVCQLEQPWLFDRYMIDFLTRHGLFPGQRSASGVQA
jgi:pimeloyl-ACP methyl ester carboxylesterase